MSRGSVCPVETTDPAHQASPRGWLLNDQHPPSRPSNVLPRGCGRGGGAAEEPPLSELEAPSRLCKLTPTCRQRLALPGQWAPWGRTGGLRRAAPGSEVHKVTVSHVPQGAPRLGPNVLPPPLPLVLGLSEQKPRPPLCCLCCSPSWNHLPTWVFHPPGPGAPRTKGVLRAVWSLGIRAQVSTVKALTRPAALAHTLHV